MFLHVSHEGAGASAGCASHEHLVGVFEICKPKAFLYGTPPHYRKTDGFSKSGARDDPVKNSESILSFIRLTNSCSPEKRVLLSRCLLLVVCWLAVLKPLNREPVLYTTAWQRTCFVCIGGRRSSTLLVEATRRHTHTHTPTTTTSPCSIPPADPAYKATDVCKSTAVQ